MLIKGFYKRFVTPVLMLMIIAFMIGATLGLTTWGGTPLAWADGPMENGATVEGSVLFETHCAGCHPKGGNIIKRGRTLKLKPLTRRHLDSVEAIAIFVTQGKGLMSAYGEILTPEDINTVSNYVWEQAQINWKLVK